MQRETFNLRELEWFKLFELEVTSDDRSVKNTKPALDIFNIAAKRLNANPHNTMIFEDALSGLVAGSAAGMRVIAVPDPNMDKSHYHGAERILNSLAEFNPAEFGMLV